jgi:polysaccharide transporter, PST family
MPSNIAKYRHEIADTIWLMLMQGLTYIVPLLVWPYLMRTLGAERFGYIGFSQSVVLMLMQVVDFGFNFTATKQIAQAQGNQEEIDRVASSVMMAKMLLLGVCALVVLGIECVPQFADYREVLGVLSLTVVSNIFSFSWLFQGLGKIRTVSIVTSLCKISILPLTFVFVHSADDVTIAAVLQASIYVAASGITCIILHKKKYVHRWNLRPAWAEVRSQLKGGFNLFLSNMATALYTTFFVMILGFFEPAEIVGKYTAAEKLVRVACYLVFIPMTQAFFPKVSAMATTQSAEAKVLIRRICMLLLLLMSLLAVAFLVGADLIVDLLRREQYAGTENLLRIMAFVPLMVSIGGVVGELGLIGLGDERAKQKYRNVYFVAGGAALIFLVALTPFFGVEGVAISLLLTESVVCGGMIFWYYKMVK